ncbi:MAG: malonyl-CoA decarboxylase [Pseudomonadota bacterium]
MTRFTALGDVLSSVIDRGARLVDFGLFSSDAHPEDLCHELMSSKGEASGVALAHQVLNLYAEMDEDARQKFFWHMARRFNPDPAEVMQTARTYAEDASPEALASLFTAVEPPRQELLRRLNMAPGGTERLVAMRADLLKRVHDDPSLKSIDFDFQHLLASWFNRGFLVMRPVDWSSPAMLLEKIIAYEAVHQINDWDDLRRRVDPPDRRCFAFFHPSMPDEPLIFVEVALTDKVPGSIQDVLSEDRDPVDPEAATTAVFYSISNCQAGLAGISFGAFLIKQVARDLSAAHPKLETFVTLSPVPGLVRWMRQVAREDSDIEGALNLATGSWVGDPSASKEAETKLMPLAARYLLTEKRGDLPLDPVARFHLGNGAELLAAHWQGDLSDKGLEQSFGIMVNYMYRLDRIEQNHEAYQASGQIAASRAIRNHLKV